MSEELLRRIAELEQEKRVLTGAVRLLHRVAKLVRNSLELEPTVYAILTGTTAGEGLAMNRAMLFLHEDGVLRGVGAVGPRDRDEADRVWRSIEKEAPNLLQLYDAGLAQLRRRSELPLDTKVRTLEVDPEGDSPVAVAFRTGRMVVGGDDDLDGLLDLPTGITAPLRSPDGALGALFADNRFTGRTIHQTTQLVLSLVADQASNALVAARTFEKVSERARIDALTGLPHHGSLMQSLGELLSARHSRAGALGLIMVDVDDFKHVNDTYGHPVGDALLAQLAARLRAVVRHPEHVYRYGGEELTVLVPDGDARTTAGVAERIRDAVGSRAFSVGAREPIPVTCSLGVASSPTHASDSDALICAADDALLTAKRNGKNRVELAPSRA